MHLRSHTKREREASTPASVEETVPVVAPRKNRRTATVAPRNKPKNELEQLRQSQAEVSFPDGLENIFPKTPTGQICVPNMGYVAGSGMFFGEEHPSEAYTDPLFDSGNLLEHFEAILMEGIPREEPVPNIHDETQFVLFVNLPDEDETPVSPLAVNEELGSPLAFLDALML